MHTVNSVADGLLLEIVNVHRNQEGHELVSDGIDYCAEHLRPIESFKSASLVWLQG